MFGTNFHENFGCRHGLDHRDRYPRVTADRTEKIETEMRDVDRIRIRKVYASFPGWHSGGGHKGSPVRQKYLLSAEFSSPLIVPRRLFIPALQ